MTFDPSINKDCPICRHHAWHGGQSPIGGHHPSCAAVREPLSFDVGDTTSDLKDAETVGTSKAATDAATKAGGSAFGNVVSAAGEGAAYGATAACVAAGAAVVVSDIVGGMSVAAAVAEGVGVGAAAGETIGPWGAVIGAVVGIIVGLVAGFAPKDKPFAAADPMMVLAMLCGRPYKGTDADGKAVEVVGDMKNYEHCLDWSKGTTVEVEGVCQPGELMTAVVCQDGEAAKALTLWSMNDQFHDFDIWFDRFGNGRSPGYKAVVAYLRSRPQYWDGWDPASVGGEPGDDINGGGMMPHPLYWFCQCVAKIAYAAGEHKATHSSPNRPFQAFEDKLGWLNSDFGGKLLEAAPDDSNLIPAAFHDMAKVLHDICVKLSQESKIEKAVAAAKAQAKHAVAKVTAPATGLEAIARVAPALALVKPESSWKRPAILAVGTAVAAGVAVGIYRRVVGK